ncbi:hypothetical protein ACJJTC_011049 [Scirpophaga incertulas]
MENLLGEDLLKTLNSTTLKQAQEKFMEILNGQNMSSDLKAAMKAMLTAKSPVVGHMDRTTAFYVGLVFAGFMASVLRAKREISRGGGSRRTPVRFLISENIEFKITMMSNQNGNLKLSIMLNEKVRNMTVLCM